ncbi:hypothetical protein JTB14_007883 [Gonioctena quinquepunctata]|nr:hypothetical protein JTB14_007883 [Gonioctena quinquepunctata]
MMKVLFLVATIMALSVATPVPQIPVTPNPVYNPALNTGLNNGWNNGLNNGWNNGLNNGWNNGLPNGLYNSNNLWNTGYDGLGQQNAAWQLNGRFGNTPNVQYTGYGQQQQPVV